MNVINIHERFLHAPAAEVGQLVDSLASSEDRLWPNHCWPAMKLDKPLGVGADGGHGPIRYVIESFTPGQLIWFRFTGPKGFDGGHGYEVVVEEGKPTLLRHTLRMKTTWPATISWPLMYRPMHDALIEDSLTNAQVSLGLEPEVKPWSFKVKMLRNYLTGGKARSQAIRALAQTSH
jgi:hypothetical protein